MQILKCFGPPGTGKTYRMMSILEQELASGVAPDRIAYLTFTVQARRVALKRVEEKFKLTKDDFPHVKTLHALCYRELNMSVDGMVKGSRDLAALGAMYGLEFTPQQFKHSDLMMDIPSGGLPGDRLIQFDHVRRHNLMSFEEAQRGHFDDDVNIFQARRFITAYEQWKRREAVRDFTDLLEHDHDPLDVDVVIVDEAQDLSKLQWKALHQLAGKAERLYIAGDDDQAIFTWAGASPQAFLDHPGAVEVLPQSYRVPTTVAMVATSISDRIIPRQKKEWRPRDHMGSVKYRGEVPQVDYTKEGSYLVLYRHHFQAADIEEHLRSQGLPYGRNDKPAPGAEWGPAIIFWERLRKGASVSWREAKTSVEAITVGQGITSDGLKAFRRAHKEDEVTLQVLKDKYGVTAEHEWFRSLTKIMPKDNQYLRQIIKRAGGDALKGKPKILLSTIHAVKGEEADHVVVLTDVSRRVQETMELRPNDERRVFYVAVTRAKDTLTIVGQRPLFK